jgi:adenine-specific DNA-methyltransferase
MSRLTELIRQAKEKDPALGAELEREYRVLSSRRAFGLNFERHRPEAVELPGRPVRRGDKARVLPPRGSTERGDRRLWRVARIEKVDGHRVARIEPLAGDDGETTVVSTDDLVVVAEFRDPIHPGLVTTGGVHRGGDRPAHTVINGENFHALKALTFTHRGTVDAIYIDPPYNTGAQDWKYNNDYVEGDDLYRHSKWLAFMERRLLLSKELLNPARSVLIVTIDEKEYLRLGLLLEQVFPEAVIQMITSVVNRKGVPRSPGFARADEYLFFVLIGDVGQAMHSTDMISEPRPTAISGDLVKWVGLRRRGSEWRRSDRPGSFFPIFVDATTAKIQSVGEPLPLSASRESVPDREGCLTVWPLNSRGEESRWQLAPANVAQLLETGMLRSYFQRGGRGVTIEYLSEGQRQQIADGQIIVEGRDENGSVVARHMGAKLQQAKSVWNLDAHGATAYGTQLLRQFVDGRAFPYPKSLYAVEDTLRFFLKDNPHSVVLDFFAGSGTTAHAVMRLNRQDGGRRQCVLVTNNEVSADEQRRLRERGLRPGDPEWEAVGICDFITKPRIEAAITGRMPDGEPIRGDYKFTDEFPMAEGFEENAEFYTLTYESPVAVGHNRAFERIAALLWLRAGARGRCIDELPKAGWDMTDCYGLLVDLDEAAGFCEAIEQVDSVRLAFVVTDDERRFQSVVRRLPEAVEPVRLYESYLSNFQFTGVEP